MQSITTVGAPQKRRYRRLKTLAPLQNFSSLPVECKNARLILSCAFDSASALFKAYQLLIRRRSPKQGGMTTDEEQDLLRAMLVMAGAGVDGMAKELIRKTLFVLVKKEPEVLNGLKKFIETQLRGKNEQISAAFMAKILVAQDHLAQVTEEYVRDLTGGSLQSAEEILSTANALGVVNFQSKIDVRKLKQVFEVRNKIIHELDMNLGGTRRKRILRSQKGMTGLVEFLFHTASTLLTEVGTKLK